MLAMEPHSKPLFNEFVFVPINAMKIKRGEIPSIVALINFQYFIFKIPATKLIASLEINGLMRVMVTAQKP